MAHADLLVTHASRLWTFAGPARARRRRELAASGEVRDGALAVRDGRIVAVGPTREVRTKFSAPEELDVENRAVLPGFVDAHTHLPFAGSRAFELEMKLAGRSYLEILRAGGGIHRTVRDTRAASQDDLVKLVAGRLDTMLRWGTTTVEAKSGYGLDAPNELKQLKALKKASSTRPVDVVQTFLGAHVVPEEYSKRRRAYVALLAKELIPRVAREGLAEYCDAFLESSAFTAGECATILGAAKKAGLGLKLHADEFTNKKGAELAARLGCVSAEHLLKVSASGVRALARSETVAVLLPGVSVTGMLDAFAPARSLVDGGAAVALGTDLNPNCNVLTMPTVLQWAVYHLRLTPAEAVAAGTVNAAYAVGRGRDVGSLEVGKKADLVILDAEDPLDLVYRIGVNPVWRVAKAGVLHDPTEVPKPLRAAQGPLGPSVAERPLRPA